MEETSLIQFQPSAIAMPTFTLQQAIERRNQMLGFVQQIMIEGIDYGTIPGTSKPTLYKSGAEKLTTFFGLTPRFEHIRDVERWGEDGTEPFFYYWYNCKLYRDDTLVGEAEGSCNSHESKYRWRFAQFKCPNCDVEAIKLSKYPPRDDPQGQPGWYCYAKIGGCGANFAADDQAIVGQTRGRVPNDDIASQVNTIQKMAQKRALVAATLIAVNASAFFTQDLEDMDIIDVVPTPAEQPEQPEQTTTPSKKETPDPPKKKAAAPPKANGTRPYAPEVVKRALEQRIKDDDGTPITKAQVGLVAGKLSECFAGDADAELKRHSVTIWLVGKESTKDLTKAEASAILDWILTSSGADDGGYYPLHVAAPAEAAAIVKASLLEAGQTLMDL